MRKKESKLHNKTLTSLFIAIWNRSKNRGGIVDMSPYTTLASVSIHLPAYNIHSRDIV